MGNKKIIIPTTRLVINIITSVGLTEKQKDEAMQNMAARLQGYYTESPDFLSDADITISRTVNKGNKIKSIKKLLNK